MAKKTCIERIPEPEVMDDSEEAGVYDAADFNRVNRSCARRVCKLLGTDRGHALDLGTGPAEIPIRICTLEPGWKITAVDASPSMLRLARRRVKEAGLEKRIRLLRADAKKLRQLRRSFSAVFSNSLLHHLHDPAPFWKEIKRLGLPGASVMIQDLRRPASKAKARKLTRLHTAGAPPLLKQLFYQSLLAAFTPAEVRAQLCAAGLDLKVRATTDRHLVASGRL
jgi:ubiquinone/menaquinone biosynthesis C-methylase UbiE|tara:strand:- start:1110 stop:1781 length:672 start_codon:yes stop_codon:yes gene_type:complete